MVRQAAGGREAIVWGKSYGPAPKFFIIGDEPTAPDYVSGSPFTGAMNQVLVNAIETLRQKYGSTMRDIYVTYFVKTTFHASDLTEKMFLEEWLPTIQLEYALTGCEYIVAMTGATQAVQGHIANTPPYLFEEKLSLQEKLMAAWEIITT